MVAMPTGYKIVISYAHLGCMAFSLRATLRHRALVQQMPYVPYARDITITYEILVGYACIFNKLTDRVLLYWS